MNLIWLHNNGIDRLEIIYDDYTQTNEVLRKNNLFFIHVEGKFVNYDTSTENIEKTIDALSVFEKVDISPNILAIFKTPQMLKNISDLNSDQYQALLKLQKNKKLINLSKYGTGKTFLAKKILTNCKKGLVIAPKYLHDSYKNLPDEILIIDLSDKEKLPCDHYDIVIVEECHLLKGKRKLVTQIKKLKYDYVIMNSSSQSLNGDLIDQELVKKIVNSLGFPITHSETVFDNLKFSGESDLDRHGGINFMNLKSRDDEIYNFLIESALQLKGLNRLNYLTKSRNALNLHELEYTKKQLSLYIKEAGRNSLIVVSSKLEKKKFLDSDEYSFTVDYNSPEGLKIISLEDLHEGVEYSPVSSVLVSSPLLNSEDFYNIINRFYRPARGDLRPSISFLIKNPIDSILAPCIGKMSKSSEARLLEDLEKKKSA